MKITGNEPAMPTPSNWNYHPGLTIRQQFAAMAMQGILHQYQNTAALNIGYIQCVAEESVVMADAVIEELNRTQP